MLAALSGLKSELKKRLPKAPFEILRAATNTSDWRAIGAFVLDRDGGLDLRERLEIVRKIYATTLAVECPHYQSEPLAFIRAVLALAPDVPGVLVEAGCFKGGSTAKLSLVAERTGRELVVFDSFEGIPENEEQHGEGMFGGAATFRAGDYKGTLDEVRANVERFGSLDSCRFVRGWFDDTLPTFREPIAAAYIDVDLASSTKTCLEHFYRLLSPGGTLFSQDGHLPLVLDVLQDRAFWQEEFGIAPPTFEGIGRRRLVWTMKQ